MKEKKLKTGKWSRAIHLGQSISKLGFGLAKDKLVGNLGETERQIRAAAEIVKTMGELKGGLMKIGQMISITDDMLFPKEVTQLFTSLQTSSNFMPKEALENIFIKSFSKSPRELFKEFDYTPIAAASIGQVHRAVLSSGEIVAVKVQYPKIVDAIKNDLDHLDVLERMFDIFKIPRPQMDRVLAEVRRSLLEECDYKRELAAMEEIRDFLQPKFPQLHIPITYPEYCSDEVLTTEFVQGDSFNESLNYSQKIRDELGSLLYESFLYSLFEHRHLHTDPQNGNYLFDQERVFLFDFGSTKKFSDNFVEDYAVLQYAVELKNRDLYREVGKNLGIVLDTDSDSFIDKHMSLVDKIYGPFIEEGIFFAKVPNPIGLVKEFVLNLNFNGRPSPSEEFLLLDRANVGLFAKLQAWQSRVNWRGGMLKYRQKALERGLIRYNFK